MDLPGCLEVEQWSGMEWQGCSRQRGTDETPPHPGAPGSHGQRVPCGRDLRRGVGRVLSGWGQLPTVRSGRSRRPGACYPATRRESCPPPTPHRRRAAHRAGTHPGSPGKTDRAVALEGDNQAHMNSDLRRRASARTAAHPFRVAAKRSSREPAGALVRWHSGLLTRLTFLPPLSHPLSLHGGCNR